MATLRVEKITGLTIEVWGKKRKRRKTFIREDTRKKLDRWLQLNDITSGYVFPSPIDWESYLSPQMIRESFKGIFGRAGIAKRNSPHDMRHTWFTTMLDNGAPLMDTAIMGGHTDPKTTRRYYHVSGVRHAAIHKTFIPTAKELGKRKKPVENRPQEMY
jgi:integrase/recombinase XerD